jgi:pilus assembly protein Flp/PilA
MKHFIQQFIRDEEGVSAIEYAAIAVVVVTAVIAIKPTVVTMFSSVFSGISTDIQASI